MRINRKPTPKQIKKKLALAKPAITPPVCGIMPPEAASYAERTAPDKLAAQKQNIADFVADVKSGRACFAQALELREQMNAAGIKGINHIYRAGKAWQRAADKNQYDFYFYDFADTLVKPEDREFLTRAVVKLALHLANTLPGEIKTVEQAAPLVQKCFIALGFELPGVRQIETAHPPANVFSELVGEFKSIDATWRKLDKECPIERWTTDQLDTALREARPVVERYERIKRLRLGN
jgi:hypothetical protein